MRWFHKFRSSKSGRYVSPEYAEHHPATTIEEREPKPHTVADIAGIMVDHAKPDSMGGGAELPKLPAPLPHRPGPYSVSDLRTMEHARDARERARARAVADMDW